MYRLLPPGIWEALWLIIAARLLIPPDIGIPVPGINTYGLLTFHVPKWVFWLRPAGFGTAMLLLSGCYIRFCRELRSKKPLNSPDVTAWMRKYAHGASCPVYILQAASTPFAYGPFFPKIVLPEQEYSTLELEHILLHEWMHIRRGDLWKKVWMISAVMLNWYNPACWLMLTFFTRDMELACDAGVLRMLPEGGCAVYAEVLLDSYSKMHPATGMRNGFLSGGLQERIGEIMHQKKISYKAKISAVLVLCVLFLTAFAKNTVSAPDLVGKTEQEAKGVLTEQHYDFWTEVIR